MSEIEYKSTGVAIDERARLLEQNEKLVDMLQEIIKYSAATLARDASGLQLMKPHYEKAQALITEIGNEIV